MSSGNITDNIHLIKMIQAHLDKHPNKGGLLVALDIGSRLRGTDPLAQGNPKHPPSDGPGPLQGENPSLRPETHLIKLDKVRQTRYQPREGA